MDFSEIGLSPELLQAVFDAGYTTPTPIQQKAIPVVATGRDVLGCAQTGTGKTASFALPMIDKLAAGRARARMPRSLILEPTRELATQVEASFEVYGKHHRLSTALLIGGERFADQERKLDRGVDVLIATPGRLLDLFERGKILLSDVRILVIDEADRMLDMGFIPDVERIVGLLPKNRQTLFFSATMPPEIRRLADAFLNDPVEIAVAPPASPAATVEQALVVVEPRDKREALRRLIASEDVKNALIFCNRKRDVDILYRSLTPARVRCGRAARRHAAAEAHRDAGALQERRDPAAGRERCRGARARHSGPVACLQFRRAAPRGGLCPPHRAHRARRPAGPRVHAGDAGGRQVGRGDRKADRKADPGRDRSRPGARRTRRRGRSSAPASRGGAAGVSRARRARTPAERRPTVADRAETAAEQRARGRTPNGTMSRFSSARRTGRPRRDAAIRPRPTSRASSVLATICRLFSPGPPKIAARA